MFKNYKLLLAALLAFSGLNAHAEDINMTTSKAVGETFTLALNAGVHATITWADGTTDEFLSRAVPVELKLKSQTFTLSSRDNITAIYAPDDGLTDIDLSKVRTGLQRLYVAGNELTSLNLRNHTALAELDVQGNKLTDLRLRGNVLRYLNCSNNQLDAITQTLSSSMVCLSCANNQLKELPNASNMSQLQTLFCQNNQISSLNIAGSTLLETIVATQNEIETLDASKMSHLRDVWLGYNKLATLDISQAPYIESVIVNNNELDNITWNDEADSTLSYICLSDNKLYFKSMPTIYNTTSRDYVMDVHEIGTQQPFFLSEDVNVNERQDWRDFLARNAWNANITPQVTVTNGAGETLQSGTDYNVASNRFTFKNAQKGVQLHVTSRYYPNIELVSQPFNVVDPTGIENIQTDAPASNGDWYTLQGVRVTNPTKGVFIHNGKKVIIK